MALAYPHRARVSLPASLRIPRLSRPPRPEVLETEIRIRVLMLGFRNEGPESGRSGALYRAGAAGPVPIQGQEDAAPEGVLDGTKHPLPPAPSPPRPRSGGLAFLRGDGPPAGGALHQGRRAGLLG
jgi:hypothetical protein